MHIHTHTLTHTHTHTHTHMHTQTRSHTHTHACVEGVVEHEPFSLRSGSKLWRSRFRWTSPFGRSSALFSLLRLCPFRVRGPAGAGSELDWCPVVQKVLVLPAQPLRRPSLRSLPQTHPHIRYNMWSLFSEWTDGPLIPFFREGSGRGSPTAMRRVLASARQMCLRNKSAQVFPHLRLSAGFLVLPELLRFPLGQFPRRREAPELERLLVRRQEAEDG